MKKTISFGKVQYIGYSRKVNKVTIDLELRDDEKGRLVFSCCGAIWNSKHTDIVCGGQCLDTIAQYINTDQFKEIHRLWKAYHLNTMHAGTPKQEKALEEKEREVGALVYKSSCDYLKSIGLYEDDGYKYGSGWLYQPIPQNDLDRIVEIING